MLANTVGYLSKSMVSFSAGMIRDRLHLVVDVLPVKGAIGDRNVDELSCRCDVDNLFRHHSVFGFMPSATAPLISQ